MAGEKETALAADTTDSQIGVEAAGAAGDRLVEGPASSIAWGDGLTVGAAPGFRPRLVRTDIGGREAADAYLEAGGYADGGVRKGELMEAVEAAGLRGRGGAAFPAGIKMRAVHDRRGPRYLVANGEEGEPASVKDRWLLRHRPHLVLDGLLRTAEAIGADRAYVVVSDLPSRASVADALTELNNVKRPGLRIELVTVDQTYVAGEETAVIRAIGGGPPLPLDKPPRPFEAGVGGQPTLVANVETLANVPFIAVHGPDLYRRAGSTDSPGTFLLTISGRCRRPGVYEVPFGVTLRTVLEELAEPVGAFRGFLMGGFFGGVLSPRATEIRLTYDELRSEGSGLGCGGVVVLGPDDCPVAAAADVLGYFARENANQCGACIRGTPAMLDAVLDLARGKNDTDRLRRWSISLRGRGACGLLDGAAAMAASLFREFPELISRHLEAPCAQCLALVPSDRPQATRFRITIDAPSDEQDQPGPTLGGEAS